MNMTASLPDSAIRDLHRDESAAGSIQAFLVKIGPDIYGLPINIVRAVVRSQQYTPIPLAPRHITGLINLRGRVVTAVDLRICMGKTAAYSNSGQLAVGVEVNGEDFALMVDEVGEVISLPVSSQVEFQSNALRKKFRWIEGVFAAPQGMITVLDIPGMLAANLN